MSDDARKKILERRAAFVAAAIASIAATSSCEPKPAISPEPCLSVMPDETGPREAEDAAVEVVEVGPTPEPHPAVCLSPMPPPADAGPKPIPQPCLSVVP